MMGRCLRLLFSAGLELQVVCWEIGVFLKVSALFLKRGTRNGCPIAVAGRLFSELPATAIESPA